MFEILVATVIVKDNKVLMVKETKEEVKGLLNLPAGHLEKNETLIEGALREIKEETGMEANITSFIDTQYFSRKEKDYVAFVFQGELVKNIEASNSELDFDFYDIKYLKENKTVLRNEKLIIPALNKINSGNRDAIDIFNTK